MPPNLPQAPQPQHGEMAAYLLGMGPMPAPRQEEIAVARAIYALDHPENGTLDPPLPVQGVHGDDAHVTVRIPVNDKLCRDISFPTTVPLGDFRDRVCAAMDLDPKATQIAWKSSDEPRRSRAHQLSTQAELNSAFQKLISLRYNPRRYKEVVMEIIPLNVTPTGIGVKEGNNNEMRNLSFSAAVRVVEEKLRCLQHGGPNRWCYVNPENPADHTALGREEVNLWARKIHDREAHPDCGSPPRCLSLQGLPQPSNLVESNLKTANFPPIHVHINNQPLASTSSTNVTHTPQKELKRRNSSASDSDDGSNFEPLLLVSVLQDLHRKFPKLNFLQYCSILETKGLIYAESVSDFDREYFVGLGLCDGAVGPFLSGVQKAVRGQQLGKKRARLNGDGGKENIA